MLAIPEATDVVIIGGGVIGCSIAWRIAQRRQRVIVLDRGQPGRGATWAAAGWLSVLGDRAHDPGFTDLARRSRSIYPVFVEEITAASGVVVEFDVCGRRNVAHDADGWFEDDAFVDSRQLGAAAHEAALRAGAIICPRTPVAGVFHQANRISGVELTDGRKIQCAWVVVAAGAWSAQIAGLPRKLPVRPIKGQMIALRAKQALPHILVGVDCYLVPRSGNRVLVGATVEDVGFAEGTTSEGLDRLRAAANRVLPQLEDAEVVETWYGFRPGTPDDLPILGPDPAVAGLVYATGHFRNGVLLAPITAEMITALVVDAEPDPAFVAFGIRRFDD